MAVCGNNLFNAHKLCLYAWNGRCIHKVVAVTGTRPFSTSQNLRLSSSSLKNSSKKSPLETSIQQNESDKALERLYGGDDPDVALITASKNDNIDIAKMALVFGANVKNCFKKVSNISGDSKNRGHILEMMKRLGAADDSNKSPESVHSCATVVDGSRAQSMTSSQLRVLCLDGGGIRGLVELQILQEIEREVGQPIAKCFDWVAGTSAGGLIALLIAHGYPVKELFGHFFKMKDKIFVGSRPYPSENYEAFAKELLGSETKMSDLTAGPRIMIFSTLANCIPAELEVFRNYCMPEALTKSDSPETTRWNNSDRAWQVARATGAAPTYFREFPPYIDGGIIANNPTLDALTEIEECYMTATGQSPKIGVIVSLGTGLKPREPVKSVDVFLPTSLSKLRDAVTDTYNFIHMLTTQVVQADGRMLDQARSWSRMIGSSYYRLNPHLPFDVRLDCKDNKVLVDMLYTTQCYLYDRRQRIVEIANLLRR